MLLEQAARHLAGGWTSTISAQLRKKGWRREKGAFPLWESEEEKRGKALTSGKAYGKMYRKNTGTTGDRRYSLAPCSRLVSRITASAL